jgi:hypothetical protein
MRAPAAGESFVLGFAEPTDPRLPALFLFKYRSIHDFCPERGGAPDPSNSNCIAAIVFTM